MSRLTPTEKKRRHFGKTSPLDRLAEPIQSELRRRCQSPETFREMRDWLLREHRCRTSQESISKWWARQQWNGWGKTSAEPTQSVFHGPFEIIVTAPGASEVRVVVRSLAVPAAS